MSTTETLQISTRVAIGAGSLVQFTGGGAVWFDAAGTEHRLPIRGTWLVAEVVRRGKRIWLDVIEQDHKLGSGARRVVLVSGRAYRRHGLLWRPYKVRRVKQPTGGGGEA